jgi:hypothetical protein
MTRHSADLLSLGFGIVFVAIAVALVAGEQVPLSWEWLAPTVVIAVGAILIAAGWNRQERSAGSESAED